MNTGDSVMDDGGGDSKMFIRFIIFQASLIIIGPAGAMATRDTPNVKIRGSSPRPGIEIVAVLHHLYIHSYFYGPSFRQD